MGSAFRAEIWEKSARNSRTGRLPPRRMARKAKIRPVQTGKDVLHPNPSGGPKNGCPALLRDEFSGRRVCGLNFGVWAPVDGTPAKFSSSKSGKRGRVSLFHAEERFSGTVYVRTMALSMNSKPRSSGIPPNSSFRGSGRDVGRMADQLSVAHYAPCELHALPEASRRRIRPNSAPFLTSWPEKAVPRGLRR